MKKKVNKLSFKEFVYFGFSYVVGITFFANIAIVTNSNGGKLGFWILLVWATVALFTYVCARAFSRLTQNHNISKNGLSYIYARTNLGRKSGLFIGFVQYCFLPFALTNNLLGLIRGVFTYQFIENAPTVQYWGAFTDLWMDLIAIALFFILFFLVQQGIKWYKKVGYISTIGNYVGFLLMIILAIAIAATPNNSSFIGSDNLAYWSHNSSISIGSFTKAFNACFYCFVGAEVMASASENIHNPTKTIGKGMVIIMILAAIFYLLLTFLFMASVQSFTEGFNITFWSTLPNSWNVHLKQSLLWLGLILTTVGLILARMYTIMNKLLFGGTTLQPLAVEGYFPDKIGKLDNNKIPVSAIRLNTIIILVMFSIWIMLPDLIKGSILTSKYGFFPNNDDYNNYDNPISMSGFMSFTSLIAIFIYLTILFINLKLIYLGKIKSNWFEESIYVIAMLLLAFVFGYHYYDLISGVILNTNTQTIIKLIIEIGTTALVISFFLVWYQLYYVKKLRKRTVGHQKRLDAAFEFIPTAVQ